MIFTVLILSDKGVALESVTEDPSFQAKLKGKQIFYIVSTVLDGPSVSKFGIAQDAARRGWNISRLRQYLKAYGKKATSTNVNTHTKSTSGRKQCHGAKLHFLATTTYEAHSHKMVADRYRKSTLVRLETRLKRYYLKRPESLKSGLRGDERVSVKPAVLIKQILELKTKLPNQVDAASDRRQSLPRRAKKSDGATKGTASVNQKYEIVAFVGDKPWKYQVKWKGYAKPTWEPKATLRRDLGDKVYGEFIKKFEASTHNNKSKVSAGRKKHKNKKSTKPKPRVSKKPKPKKMKKR